MKYRIGIIVIIIISLFVFVGCTPTKEQDRCIIVRNTRTNDILYQYSGKFFYEDTPRELIVYTEDGKYQIMFNDDISYSVKDLSGE